jgi:hypothetical protein
MDAVQAFQHGSTRNLGRLNSALIALLPKKVGASCPADFRPITMIHSFAKIISKVLALRLAPRLPDIVDRNQNAFVKARTIQDNYKYVQRAAVLIRKKKIPMLLLKLDISKAFDTLSWPFLLEVLKAHGFGDTWRRWIEQLLSTASSRILLNGRQGPLIKHLRGVRQGDSLSPMLFIIAMDVLNRLFKRAASDGVLRRMPVEGIKFQCSMYADDVILFIHPTVQEARAVKQILAIFGDASGLRTNLAKCSITPIYGGEDSLPDIVHILGCQVIQFPIKYLGLPLSTRAIPKAHYQSLVEAVARKLPPCHGTLMARSGRLVWVKSVLRAVPIYAMLAENLPPWARKELDAICRRFFWAGGEQSTRGKCMVAWSTCCRPTHLGGLGISDLKLAGYALQTRWLWLQRTDHDRAWSELPINAAKDVQAFFQASTYTRLGDGRNTLFWEDRWINGMDVQTIAPYLYLYIPRRVRCSLTVRDGLHQRSWVRCIRSGVPVAALVDYLHLWAAVDGVQLSEQPDRLIWRWTADGSYSAKSAYDMLHTGAIKLRGHRLIWRTWAPMRVKIFLWLAFKRRHWTGDRRRRHGLEAREICYFCDQSAESIDHILVTCPFTREIWYHILHTLGKALPPAAQSTLGWWRRLRALFAAERRAGVDSLFALTCWHLWKERNARCFRETSTSITDLLQIIKAEGDRWAEAGAKGLRELALAASSS